MLENKFLITTPIYYANGEPHLGHAYTTLIADILSRHYRFLGKDVFFLTGLDEHGAKIEQAAKENHKNPQDFCDEKAEIFQKTWKDFDFQYNNFIRTTQKSHIKATQKFLDFLNKENLIYKNIYKGFYCIACEQLKNEADLIDGLCPDHKTKPILINEESYFFKLSQFQEDLSQIIQNNTIGIFPKAKRNEILEFYKLGLRDISISRKNVKWGIPLPFHKNFTVYVWIDAFLSYLTGIGWDGDANNIPDFWDNVTQIMGKDILRVHGTIWLGLLKALNFSLPKRFFVHGYFTVNGQKMSKTIGNVIAPKDLIENFGSEASRFIMAHSMSYGLDTDISWDRLRSEYNDILVKNLGNLVSRSMKLAEDYYKENAKFEFRNFITEIYDNYNNNLENLKFSESINEILRMINFANRYIDQEKPWSENCLNRKRVISNLLIVLYCVASMLAPFMPKKSKEIFEQLGVDKMNLNTLKEIEKLKFHPKKKQNLFPIIK